MIRELPIFTFEYQGKSTENYIKCEDFYTWREKLKKVTLITCDLFGNLDKDILKRFLIIDSRAYVIFKGSPKYIQLKALKEMMGKFSLLQILRRNTEEKISTILETFKGFYEIDLSNRNFPDEEHYRFEAHFNKPGTVEVYVELESD